VTLDQGLTRKVRREASFPVEYGISSERARPTPGLAARYAELNDSTGLSALTLIWLHLTGSVEPNPAVPRAGALWRPSLTRTPILSALRGVASAFDFGGGTE
jgi:hypothetical protein